MERKETEIIYFGQKAKVACDMKCNKAWGFTCRPKIYVNDPEQRVYGLGSKHGYWASDEFGDEDDYFCLSDDELEEAPECTGTWEGGDGKPFIEDMKDKDVRHNKWCVRACERCVMTEHGKPDEELKIKDWSKRRYNIPKSNPEYKDEQ